MLGGRWEGQPLDALIIVVRLEEGLLSNTVGTCAYYAGT